MGKDLRSSVVKIECDLYQLPCPVSAFLDNGWQIIQQSGDVVAGGTDYIRIEKNGKKVDLSIINYADLIEKEPCDNATVTEYAAEKGIKTCTENHGYIAQDSYRVEQLFNAVAHDNYGLLVDVGNFVCADEDNCAAVSRVAPYAVHVHAKDMYKSATPAPGFGQTRGCNYFKGAIVGEGDVNVEKCLQILKRVGYDGYCSIEFEGSEDCIEGIAKGFENLKGMLERI